MHYIARNVHVSSAACTFLNILDSQYQRQYYCRGLCLLLTSSVNSLPTNNRKWPSWDLQSWGKGCLSIALSLCHSPCQLHCKSFKLFFGHMHNCYFWHPSWSTCTKWQILQKAIETTLTVAKGQQDFFPFSPFFSAIFWYHLLYFFFLNQAFFFLSINAFVSLLLPLFLAFACFLIQWAGNRMTGDLTWKATLQAPAGGLTLTGVRSPPPTPPTTILWTTALHLFLLHHLTSGFALRLRIIYRHIHGCGVFQVIIWTHRCHEWLGGQMRLGVCT